MREIIETYDDLRIVGEAVNGEEAVLLAAKLKPAAVVMDVHLPVLNGVPATTLIKTNNPFTAIIAWTAGDPHDDEKAMILAGAAVVINKSDVLQALHPAQSLTGHLTRSVFLRYDIVDDKDLSLGVEKLAAFQAEAGLQDNYGTVTSLPSVSKASHG